jgi:biotin carboxyl carrier protein
LTFYQVSEEELDSLLGQFRAGKFTFEYEDVEFDMADHNRLLQDTVEEVKKIRAHQAVAQEKMIRAESLSFERWQRERLDNQIDGSTVERLLDGPHITPIEAPADANVWKVEVKEGDTVGASNVVSIFLNVVWISLLTRQILILEAMKLEIAVKTPDTAVAGGAKLKVQKLLVKPGDTVTAGGHLALLKKE